MNIIFNNLLLLKTFLYLYDILSKMLLELFFQIIIKTFLKESYRKKTLSTKILK